MALSNDVYGSVATPRIFIDYVQFCRSLGIPIGHYSNSFENESFQEVWNMNPAKTTISWTEETTGFDDPASDDHGIYYCRWGVQIDTSKTRPEIQKLLSTCNYYAVLGHNFGDISTFDTEIRVIDSDLNYGADDDAGLAYESAESQYAPDSVLYGGNGYKIKTISPNLATATSPLENCGFLLLLKTMTESTNIQVGAISVGRYFDFPHSANLSMNIDYAYDGIKKKRTIGGSDLVNVSYNHPPNWIGKHRPFTASYANSIPESGTIGYGGRRSWDLAFSFLDKTAAFPKNFNEDFIFSTHISSSGDNYFGTYKQENILSHYFSLTQGGSIAHILQPDKTKEDFCLVRLDKQSLRINQTAPLLYDVKMRFVETW